MADLKMISLKADALELKPLVIREAWICFKERRFVHCDQKVVDGRCWRLMLQSIGRFLIIYMSFLKLRMRPVIVSIFPPMCFYIRRLCSKTLQNKLLKPTK